MTDLPSAAGADVDADERDADERDAESAAYLGDCLSAHGIPPAATMAEKETQLQDAGIDVLRDC